MKRFFIIVATMSFAFFFNACVKEESTHSENMPSVEETNNELVGTSWSCNLWHFSNHSVIAYIDFETNTRATATITYKNENPSLRSGSYTLNGKSITFNGLDGYGNTMHFSFNSATFSPSVMIVHGTKNGNDQTWTFRRK